MDPLPTGTRQKALALNLDKVKYGTIAASVSAHDMAGGGEKKALFFTSETR